MLNIRSANINPKMAFGIFLKFFLAIDFAMLLMFPSAAAESRSLTPNRLTCNVTRQADGFSYHLSRPPSSPECTSCWESKNRTVVARDIENLTQNVCQSYLRYTRDCPDVINEREEAHCEFNCSHILDLPTTTVDSTLIKFGLGVAGILLLVVVGSAALVCQKKKICNHWRASYTAANGKNAMEQEEMVEVKVII